MWGRHWLPILLPILLLICATGMILQSFYLLIYLSLGAVFKIISIYKTYITGSSDAQDLIIYSSSVLATTLWCTVLIIYRIVTVARAGKGELRAYRHVIEVFIESSALYSITLIVYIGFYSRNDWTSDYTTPFATIARVWSYQTFLPWHLTHIT